MTEQKRAEEALRLSEQKMALHVEQTPLGVVEMDADFRISEWNPSAERIFGYKKEEVVGRHHGFMVPESARPQVDAVGDALMHQEGGTRSTNENITRDGRIITCEWFNTPLVDRDGRILGIASLVEDVTERKKAEAALAAAEEKYRIVADNANCHTTMVVPFSSVFKSPSEYCFNRQFWYCSSAAALSSVPLGVTPA